MPGGICEFRNEIRPIYSGVDSGGAGGAITPPEFGGSEKGQSLISAYRSSAITASTSGFENLSTALLMGPLKLVISKNEVV